MSKKALIIDLDNTIFPVASIGDMLFAPLFDLLKTNDHAATKFDEIRKEVMRRPFQLVAREFHLSKELTDKSIDILKDLTFNGKIIPFPDFEFVRQLTLDKFLVTTGFKKMQQSKVDAMQLSRDFKEIHIIDPMSTGKVKKDVFAEIMERCNYGKSEVLVVGDDIHSEIRAAQELGIDAVLYDKTGFYKDEKSVISITDFTELRNHL